MKARCPKCQQVLETVTTPNKKKVVRTKLPKHKRFNRNTGQMKRCYGSFKTVKTTKEIL